jgi:selenide,water dikinase
MSELTQVLRRLLPVEDPNALVDATTGDDAAVYRIAEGRALVVTVDYFTPIVDDAFDFGRIGAANSLSDIYAMGARPLFALNLVSFPRKLLGEGLLEDIVSGGAAICREAGIPVLGGHSIDDPEPKFGMVVVGEVETDRLVTNAAARPGDRLVLTKPLGSGVIATAVKADAAPEEVVARAVEVMTTLNRGAAAAMASAGARAATDVTGYGLLGHLRSMLRASAVAAVIDSGAVPLLPGAVELAAAGHVPGGTRRNLTDLADDLTWAGAVPEPLRTLLVDAQTSGGLLIAVPPEKLAALLAALSTAGTPAAAVVGEVVEGGSGTIAVR